MEVSAILPQDERGADDGASSLFNDLISSTADPKRWPDVPGLLRAVADRVFQAATSMRQEQIRPLAHVLRYVSRRFPQHVRDDAANADPRYLLGQIDALLSLCMFAADRSLAATSIEQAKRKHGRDILGYIRAHRTATPTDLADHLGLPRDERNRVSNILKWMGEAGLVRRTKIGGSTVVSLGPQGEAAYAALLAAEPAGNSPTTEHGDRGFAPDQPRIAAVTEAPDDRPAHDALIAQTVRQELEPYARQLDVILAELAELRAGRPREEPADTAADRREDLLPSDQPGSAQIVYLNANRYRTGAVALPADPPPSARPRPALSGIG